METEKYVVLRSREISAPPRGDMGARAGAALPAGLRRQVVKLEEVELTKRERNDLRRDPSTRAIALPMPLQIMPTAPFPAERSDSYPLGCYSGSSEPPGY